jgi:CRISPR/Cas system-associated endonuclease Cas3-HD
MKCPGQDPRFWKFDAIFEVECPNCGYVTEFFKDETRRTCKKCGEKVLNPRMDFGCAAHCKFAKDCFGDLPPELIKEKVARYAEKLVHEEKGDPAVVLTAAYLHDIGIKNAEEKYQSAAPRYQHEEGPPVAREILSKLDANEHLIEEVCDIIGHHHSPRDEETTNFKVLFDADTIVNLEEKHKKDPYTPEKLSDIIETRLLTESGKALARNLFFGEEAQAAANG